MIIYPERIQTQGEQNCHTNPDWKTDQGGQVHDVIRCSSRLRLSYEDTMQRYDSSKSGTSSQKRASPAMTHTEVQ